MSENKVAVSEVSVRHLAFPFMIKYIPWSMESQYSHLSPSTRATFPRFIKNRWPGFRLAGSIRRLGFCLTKKLGWNRSSYFIISAFVMTLLLLGYVWWPLAAEYLSYIDWQGQWWRYIDWLLIAIFIFMSLMIMAKADLRLDAKIILVGLVGGLVIESWGTQTEIWTYYTEERPPLWIIPAWPIASLTIDRMVRLIQSQRSKIDIGDTAAVYKILYWLVFLAFLGLMVAFTRHTLDKPLTIFALLLTVLVVLTPTDHRLALITFAAGSGLGYFLEYWGTTRGCWTYYTGQMPPLFAVLAHGMAAVVFWRCGLLLSNVYERVGLVGTRRAASEESG